MPNDRQVRYFLTDLNKLNAIYRLSKELCESAEPLMIIHEMKLVEGQNGFFVSCRWEFPDLSDLKQAIKEAEEVPDAG